MLDRIIYIPYIPKHPKHKGNGDKQGIPAGHLVRSLDNSGSLTYGDGCLYHNCPSCSMCPIPDCDYDHSREHHLKKESRALKH